MAKSISPTVLSLRYLRGLGYDCEVAEKFVRFPPPGHRKDLFGFIDLFALCAGRTVAVQTTSDSNLAARVNKIRSHERYWSVRRALWIIEVHGWKKVGNRWRVRIVDMESGRERNG